MLVKVGGTEVDIRVEAILSMPRLSFTANHFAWAQALMPLGIRPTMGTGAFWSQVNTRVMEQFVDKAEYLLLLDYDTFMTKEDIEHLFALAMTFQCDAITGLQTKREDGRPMDASQFRITPLAPQGGLPAPRYGPSLPARPPPPSSAGWTT